MFVGLIIAGDGEVEVCMTFPSRDAAEEYTDRVWKEYFDQSYDTKVIAVVQTYDDVVSELEKAREEDAHVRDYPITD